MSKSYDTFIKFRDKTYEAVLDGRMSKEKYCAFWDEFQKMHSEFVDKEFGYKLHGLYKSSRTLGKFSLNLLSVLKEIRVKEFLKEYGKKYFPDCNIKKIKQASIEKNGKVQSGKLILNSELKDRKRENFETDWVIDEKYRLDYKTINGMNICTPKLKDLVDYIKVDSGILIEFFDGDDADAELLGKLYFSSEKVKKIYEDTQTGKLKTCEFYGGKPAVQFWINPKRKSDKNNCIEGYYSEFVKQ